MQKTRINREWDFWKWGEEASKKQVNLPHDAMILEERIADLPNGNATGFLPGGKYVYTKNIFGEESYRDKTVFVEFEGIYRNSSVYLNGELIGGWLYGYTNFFVDLTDRLQIGRPNELWVVADNSETPNSRWYSGSGIYRPVNLWVGGKAHILPEGVKIKTVSLHPAVIEIVIETENAAGMEVVCAIAGEDTDDIAESHCMVGDDGKAHILLEIPNAELWDAEHPNLYSCRAVLAQPENGETAKREPADRAEERFGIRMLGWNAEHGFQVNGETVKLRGGCVHHDHGILGACAYDKAEMRRIKKLKEFGFNAIRYSHNPAGKNFLEACDRLGIYVIDESFDQWKLPQTAYDYAKDFDTEWKKDVAAMVSKDYNHPCVIMYSIGNEITDTGLPHGAVLAKMLSEAFHGLDDTRPTMLANNAMLTVLANLKAKKAAQNAETAEKKADAAVQGAGTEDKKADTATHGTGESQQTEMAQTEKKSMGSAEVNDIVTLLPKIMASITPESLEALMKDVYSAVDIAGYNYGQNLYAGTHEMAPDRVILSSETFPVKMASNWAYVEQNDYCIGDFLWTAWDYLGEAGVGAPVYGSTQAPFSKAYPCLTAGCGSMDLTGYPESQAYYEAVLWGRYQKPYIGVRPVNHSGEEYTLGRWRLTDSLACWSWPGQEGKTAQIEVYSMGDTVELFQDGISLGRKGLADCRADFEAVYHPGRLEAVSFSEDGAELARCELMTAGEETQIRVMPEETEIRADGEDIVFVPIHVTDKDGNLKMAEDRKLTVAVEGPARLLALGSGRHETEERFDCEACTFWHGRALAVLQSTGKPGNIHITVQAEQMEGFAEIEAK